MGNIQKADNQNWKSIESSAKPVLVDFWAEWCGPCRMMEPAFEKLAETHAADFGFAKLNVDDSPEIAAKFGIRSIPTLLLLREGKILEQVVGARSFNELSNLLEAHAPAPAKTN